MRSNIITVAMILLLLIGFSRSQSSFAAAVSTAVTASSAPAYGLQPAPTSINICFVGDALTSVPTRIQQIKDAIHGNDEAAANVRFSGFGTCAAPTKGKCGTDNHSCDQYPGDIRIALAGANFKGKAVPQVIPASYSDCADRGANSSWSHFPDVLQRSDHRACPYNSWIGNDSDNSVKPVVPWLNHPLHEIGHALGLVHEFLQHDFYNYVGPNGKVCSTSLKQPSGDGLTPLTPVDSLSVMMYVDQSCGIEGNYAQTGYSAKDRLSLHILYPEPVRVAEYVGTTVVQTNQMVSLTTAWSAQGASDDVFSTRQWSVGGVSSTGTGFATSWGSAGVKSGSLTYTDFLGRNYSTALEVRVLTPTDYISQIVVPIASSAALM